VEGSNNVTKKHHVVNPNLYIDMICFIRHFPFVIQINTTATEVLAIEQMKQQRNIQVLTAIASRRRCSSKLGGHMNFIYLFVSM